MYHHSRYLPFGFASCLPEREVAKAIRHIQETLRYPIQLLSTPTVLSSLGIQDPYGEDHLTTRLLNPHRRRQHWPSVHRILPNKHV